MQLITHRAIDVGLGDSQGWALQESRWESFLEQIRAGCGLEFDVQLLNDGRFVVSHDSSLARIVPGCNKALSSLSTDDLRSFAVPNGRLCSLEELLSLIVECGRSISALHLKSHCQEMATLERILDAISPKIDSLIGRLLIFDARPQVAAQIMQRFPELDIAASVAHPFDVLRYGAITGGTLLTPQEVFANRHLYSWVWLDEWDTLDANSEKKTFVNSDSVNFFQNLGLKVAAVSPELHALSPALLGGEKHEDGADVVRLVRRWQQWSQLGIDALCTDHASWISTNLQPQLMSGL